MISVAIADDSPFTCKLLASYVEDGGECRVVGLAHDAQSTIELIRRETPDVLTLDLQMPGGDGLDLLRLLADEPPVSIVVISGVTRLAAAITLKALELGAVDFILKYTPDAPVSRSAGATQATSRMRHPLTRPPIAPVKPIRRATATGMAMPWLAAFSSGKSCGGSTTSRLTTSNGSEPNWRRPAAPSRWGARSPASAWS